MANCKHCWHHEVEEKDAAGCKRKGFERKTVTYDAVVCCRCKATISHKRTRSVNGIFDFWWKKYTGDY